MHYEQANSFIKSLIVLASLFSSGFAVHVSCPIATRSLSGIGDEYVFFLGKQALGPRTFGHSQLLLSTSWQVINLCPRSDLFASILTPRAFLYAGAAPFLKITGASEQPSVSTVDGVLTISTESCNATDPTSSASTLLHVGIMASFLAPRWSSLIFAFSFMSTLTGAYGHQIDTCMPSIEIEISLPVTTDVTTVFGETDHYLKATTETVRWGYFDGDAPFMATMESGETITVEVITHHSGHDYAKMIRGDDAVAEIFYWGTGTSLTEKPVPKLPGTGVHLITGPSKLSAPRQAMWCRSIFLNWIPV